MQGQGMRAELSRCIQQLYHYSKTSPLPEQDCQCMSTAKNWTDWTSVPRTTQKGGLPLCWQCGCSVVNVLHYPRSCCFTWPVLMRYLCENKLVCEIKWTIKTKKIFISELTVSHVWWWWWSLLWYIGMHVCACCNIPASFSESQPWLKFHFHSYTHCFTITNTTH